MDIAEQTKSIKCLFAPASKHPNYVIPKLFLLLICDFPLIYKWMWPNKHTNQTFYWADI